MKKNLLLIGLVFLFMFVPFVVDAEEQKEDTMTIDGLSASKVTEKVEGEAGTFDVQISVPGKDYEEIQGNNIIIVMDGSYSTDGNWSTMRQAVLDAVEALLPSSVKEENVNRVALLSFGMGSHINIPLTNDKSLFYDVENLPSDKGGSLLRPGRSSTNIEVGFSGAKKYLESLSEEDTRSIEQTYVIFISDGAVNMSEAEFDFYELAKTKYFKNVVNSFLGVSAVYDEVIKTEGYENTYAHEFVHSTISKVKELYNTYYEDGDSKTLEEMLMTLDSNYSEVMNEFKTNLVDDLYDLIGYDRLVKKTYSPGDYERLINAVLFSTNDVYYHYEEVTDSNGNPAYQLVVSRERVYNVNGKVINDPLNSAFEDTYYQPIFIAINKGEESVTRAINAGKDLSEISTIYTIGVGVGSKGKRVLDQNLESYSSKYIESNIDKIGESFEDLIYPIVKTNYRNVELVDYTSKWVIPVDINGDLVFDSKDIVVKNSDGNVVNASIKVEKLGLEDIKNSLDPEILGNTNGDIYKITWLVGEYLHSWDQYSLSYKVKVDTQEEGFESYHEDEKLNTYKANGEVTLTYDIVEKIDNEEVVISTDNKGEVLVDDPVYQKENVVILVKKDQENNDLSGADFSISSDNNGLNQVKKEYSKDGITWFDNNELETATYFRFTGLYDFTYQFLESIVPEGYQVNDIDLVDFTNQEGNSLTLQIVNYAKGKVIVHYIDQFGNKLTEDVVIEGVVGDNYQSTQKEFDGYYFQAVDGDSSGKISKGTIEVTYIYSKDLGTGDTDLEEDKKPGIGDTDLEENDKVENEEPKEEEKEEIIPPKTGIVATSNTRNNSFVVFMLFIITSFGLSYRFIKIQE